MRGEHDVKKDRQGTHESATSTAAEISGIDQGAGGPKTAGSPLSADRRPIDERVENTRREAKDGILQASAEGRGRLSPERRAAFEPLLNWMADRILEQLLEEQRAEIEGERNELPDPGEGRDR